MISNGEARAKYIPPVKNIRLSNIHDSHSNIIFDLTLRPPESIKKREPSGPLPIIQHRLKFNLM